MIIDLTIKPNGNNYLDIIDFINDNTPGKKYDCGNVHIYEIEKEDDSYILYPFYDCVPVSYSKENYELLKHNPNILYYKYRNEEGKIFFFHPLCEAKNFYEFSPEKKHPDFNYFYVFGLYGYVLETYHNKISDVNLDNDFFKNNYDLFLEKLNQKTKV